MLNIVRHPTPRSTKPRSSVLNRIHIGLAIAAAIVGAPLHALPVAGVDALREWNLIVLGNLDSSSEVEGRTFVGGDLTGPSSNYQIGTPSPSSTVQPGLTVVGNVTGGTKNLNNGSGAIVGGNVESGFNLNGPAQTVSIGGAISNTNINQNIVKWGWRSLIRLLPATSRRRAAFWQAV